MFSYYLHFFSILCAFLKVDVVFSGGGVENYAVFCNFVPVRCQQTHHLGMMRKSFVITFLMLVVMCLTVAFTAVALEPADTVRVRLVTFYPGSEVFSVYGHTEIRVTQGDADYYFNYGVFDFNTPGFVYRFVTGEADYLCMAVPPQYAMMEPGRRMVEQELNFTQEQACLVRDLLVANALPPNNTYRYQYLTDNCSTRPRDIIEQALGQPLHNPAVSDTVTYRQVMAHYARNYPWLQFDIDLVLGSVLDRTIDEREQMFIPMALMRSAAGTMVERDGRTVPLVHSTQVMVDGSEDGIVLPATPWPLTPLAAMLGLLALTVLVSISDLRLKRPSRWFDTLLYGALAMVGCVLFFLIFVSVREATSPNYNAFWAHPFCLLLAVLPWVSRFDRLLRGCHVANALVVALLLLVWPWLPQVANVAFFPVMIASLLRSALNVFLLNSKRKNTTK